jgi:hypothetical protein
MDALQLFLIGYEPLHGDMDRGLLADLTEDQVRSVPQAGLNSVAWTLWHMTRCEDIAFNRLIADHPQVLDDAWARRLNVSVRDIATGMADDDVVDLSTRIDIEGLLAYRTAVSQRTLEVVHTLRPEDLDQTLSQAQLRRVIDEGVLGPNAGWVEQNWDGRPKGWYLIHLGVNHNRGHFGEARIVRTLFGFRGR